MTNRSEDVQYKPIHNSAEPIDDSQVKRRSCFVAPRTFHILLEQRKISSRQTGCGKSSLNTV